jgi:nicotinic acid mononucleotide adenylyltransferase
MSSGLWLSPRLTAALDMDGGTTPRVADVAKRLASHYDSTKSILECAVSKLGGQKEGAYVIGSFQGAFSPATRGHFEAMKFAIDAYVATFPGHPIRLFFMPGGRSGSKKHIQPTIGVRFNILALMCKVLNYYCKNAYPSVDIHIDVSPIEIVLAECYEAEGKAADTTTVNTFLMLHLLYPEAANITVVLGYDNLLGITTWKLFPYYQDLITHVFVPKRPATAAEEASKDTTISALATGGVEYIELGQPTATSSSMLRCIYRKLRTNSSSNSYALDNAITTLSGFNIPLRGEMAGYLEQYMDIVVPMLTEADCAKPDAIFPNTNLPRLLPEDPLVTAYYKSLGYAGGKRRKSKKRTHRKSRKSKKSKRSSK